MGTKPVRKCGLKAIIRTNWGSRCLDEINFSPPCKVAWLWNINFTYQKCGKICFQFTMGRSSSKNNEDSGELNECLACDERESGPKFLFFAGRIRRNSGLISAIQRPEEQVSINDHCY